ncbi:MAG: hypothetical protein ACMVP2_16680 [Imperialibacter sp.]|uniref:hypothetical protein n=1 Tax=Imperialibacter sp. TaxID=2038411 RepID=UPI003A86E419
MSHTLVEITSDYIAVGDIMDDALHRTLIGKVVCGRRRFWFGQIAYSWAASHVGYLIGLGSFRYYYHKFNGLSGFIALKSSMSL